MMVFRKYSGLFRYLKHPWTSDDLPERPTNVTTNDGEASRSIICNTYIVWAKSRGFFGLYTRRRDGWSFQEQKPTKNDHNTMKSTATAIRAFRYCHVDDGPNAHVTNGHTVLNPQILIWDDLSPR